MQLPIYRPSPSPRNDTSYDARVEVSSGSRGMTCRKIIQEQNPSGKEERGGPSSASVSPSPLSPYLIPLSLKPLCSCSWSECKQPRKVIRTNSLPLSWAKGGAGRTTLKRGRLGSARGFVRLGKSAVKVYPSSAPWFIQQPRSEAMSALVLEE